MWYRVMTIYTFSQTNQDRRGEATGNHQEARENRDIFFFIRLGKDP